MLVLSRRESEDIIITPVDEKGKPLEPIIITVVSSDRGRTRLGINAPRTYAVNRREIQEEIDKNKKPEQKLAAIE